MSNLSCLGITCEKTIDHDEEMFCDNSDGIDIDINSHGLKLYQSGIYEISLSGLAYIVSCIDFEKIYLNFLKEPSEIGKINVMRTVDGVSDIVLTAFAHVKDAWHDDGIHFGNLTLPISAQASDD